MNISAPFIRRPVATSLLTAALLLYGSIAFRELPVASLPQVAYPVIQVEADLPGANADTLASAIATPLERMFGRIAGVNQMTSLSRLGKTQIVLQFDLDRDIDAAARDVQAAINAARGQLPANLPTNPSLAQGQSRRSADHGFGAYFRYGHARSHVRRGGFDPGPEAPADRRHRAGAGGGQFAAGRPRGGQPAAVEQAGHQPRSGARGDQRRQCPFAEGLLSRIGTAQHSPERQ